LKYCGKCKTWKELVEFGKANRNWDNLKNECKICKNKAGIIYANKDRERRRKLGKDHEINRKLRKQKAESARNWRLNYPERYRESRRIYNEKNREKDIERSRNWQRNNIEKVRKAARKRAKQRRKNPTSRLNLAISGGIRKSLKNGKRGRHWEDLVGWTLEDLMCHLAKKFFPGMTWENWGRGTGKWHIDHEIPINAFNFTSHRHPDFKRCWALQNLKPMWSEENLRKHAKLDKPFQPSLLLENKKTIYFS